MLLSYPLDGSAHHLEVPLSHARRPMERQVGGGCFPVTPPIFPAPQQLGNLVREVGHVPAAEGQACRANRFRQTAAVGAKHHTTTGRALESDDAGA